MDGYFPSYGATSSIFPQPYGSLKILGSSYYTLAYHLSKYTNKTQTKMTTARDFRTFTTHSRLKLIVLHGC